MTSSKSNKVETGEKSFLEYGVISYEEVNESQKLTILESIASMQKRIETFQRENLSKIQSLERQFKLDNKSHISSEPNSNKMQLQSKLSSPPQNPIQTNSSESDSKKDENELGTQCNCFETEVKQIKEDHVHSIYVAIIFGLLYPMIMKAIRMFISFVVT